MATKLTHREESEGLASASIADKIINCPGSPAMEAAVPYSDDADSTPIAEQGTRIHEAWETGDDEELQLDEKEIAIRLRSLEEKAVASWRLPDDPEPVIHREERFWIRHPQTLERVASAKLDVAYVSGKRALILDGKTGFKKQKSSNVNWQVRTQLVALYHEHPQLEEIEAGIAASRLYEALDTTVYRREDILNCEALLFQGLWAAAQPDAPRRPGVWCEFCRAKSFCREQAALATIDSRELVTLPDQYSVALKVEAMTLPAVAKLWHTKDALKWLMTAVQSRLMQLDEAALAELGLLKKPGAEVRKITDPVKAVQLLRESGLSESEALSCASVAVGKVEALVAQKNGMTKKAATVEVNTLLEKVMEKKQNSPSLKAV